MEELFTSFFLTSVMGSVIFLLFYILKPVTHKIFSSRWNYYVWLIVLFVMMCPLRLNLPDRTVVSYNDKNEDIQIMYSDNTKTIDAQYENVVFEQSDVMSAMYVINDYLSNKLLALAYIWLSVALILLIIKIVSYLTFLKKLYKHSEIIYCPEVKTYTKRKVVTRISNSICSPLMIGILRPVLLLPDTEITKEQLNNILAHEFTHLNRYDILYKWVVSIVKCVHWYNPVIYLISREVDLECEISCDLSVVNKMNEREEKEYIETILLLLKNNNSGSIPQTSGMANNIKALKRRFTMIKNRKHIGKTTGILSVIIAIALLITTLFVSGVLATDFLKNNYKEVSENIKICHNGNHVQLNNKPFYKNDILYLPLSELFEKTGLMDNKNSYIKREDEKITFCISEGDNIPDYDASGNQKGIKPVTIQYYYGIEIGKAEYTLNPEGTLPEHRKHLSQTKKMSASPVLKDDVVYIPYEYVEYMISRVMQNHKITIDAGDRKNIIKAEKEASSMKYSADDVQLIGETEKQPEIKTNDNSETKTISEGKEDPLLVSAKSFVWPVDSMEISEKFGVRKHPITGEERNHLGVDIKASENSDVVSSIYGKVEDTGYDTQMGNYIVISNENGIKVRYCHLSSVNVEKGDKTFPNEVIGKVGKTGKAVGAFLHFEVNINERYYDPEELFKKPE